MTSEEHRGTTRGTGARRDTREEHGHRPAPGRRAARALAVLALAPALAACQPAAGETCVSWADLPDDAARADAARLVVDVDVLGRDGTRGMLGTDAHVWEVEVTDVVQAGAATVRTGDRLAVASTPQTCTGDDASPDGDPLDVDGPVRLYLTDDHQLPHEGEGWSLITPFDGVAPAP